MPSDPPTTYTSLHHVTAESVKVGATAEVIRIGPSLELYADSYDEIIAIGERIVHDGRQRKAVQHQARSARMAHPAGTERRDPLRTWGTTDVPKPVEVRSVVPTAVVPRIAQDGDR